jgi:hypothetical protein
MNGVQMTVDWVHPSVRDTVIEYLMDHDGDRDRFLRTASASGALLALSTAGGATGARIRPLLLTPEDWVSLSERIKVIGEDCDDVAQLVLLQGLREALIASSGDDQDTKSKLGSLTHQFLDALYRSWNANSRPLMLGTLELFYEMSERVSVLIPSPDLRPTWERLHGLVGSAIADEIRRPELCDWVRQWAELVEVIRINEPRFLRMSDVASEIEASIQTVIEIVVGRVEEFAQLDSEEDEWIEYEEDWIEAPVEPEPDEVLERQWLDNATDMVESIAEVSEATRDKAVKVLEIIREHAASREARLERWREWEHGDSDSSDQRAWDASRGQGSGDFDISEFFADL